MARSAGYTTTPDVLGHETDLNERRKSLCTIHLHACTPKLVLPNLLGITGCFKALHPDKSCEVAHTSKQCQTQHAGRLLAFLYLLLKLFMYTEPSAMQAIAGMVAVEVDSMPR